MIVIADTGPVNYLILIGEIEVLPKLYGGIFVPFSVRDELQRHLTPSAVRQWIAQPPDWIVFRAPNRAPDASAGSQWLCRPC